MYVPFRLPRQIVEKYGYVIYFAIAIQEKLFDFFFVGAEVHIFYENTALVSIVLRIN